jgi:hypothetical protein
LHCSPGRIATGKGVVLRIPIRGAADERAAVCSYFPGGGEVMKIIAIVATIVLLPLALLALAIGLLRFAALTVEALAEEGISRFARTG